MLKKKEKALYIQKKLAEAKGIQNELDDVVTDSIGATQASKEYHE